MQDECEKRQAEADIKMRLYDKQAQDLQQMEKELTKFREMYRNYMNGQILPPTFGDYGSNNRLDRGGHGLF